MQSPGVGILALTSENAAVNPPGEQPSSRLRDTMTHTDSEPARGPGQVSRQEVCMQVRSIIANLKVDDVDDAGFYADYLGLSVQEFTLGWVARYTSPETGAHLQLVSADATSPQDSVVSVTVDDVDAAHAEALRRGYDIVRPLNDEAWGVRRFLVRAPDGNVVNILQNHA